jgi:macrodomain Ter protein organizer (MatP/YcbG family)
LELGNAKVDVEDLRTEVTKLKSNLDPYKTINNELTYLRGAIDRSNKDLELLTLSQIEKRMTLYKEEYNEHIALCSAAVAKLVDLAEIRVCFMRVLNAERKRATKAEHSLEFVIWVRKTTYKVSVVTLVSIFVGLLSMLIYWRFFA